MGTLVGVAEGDTVDGWRLDRWPLEGSWVKGAFVEVEEGAVVDG